MKRPVESDHTSHVAYTRALEEYCDWLRQPAPVQDYTTPPAAQRQSARSAWVDLTDEDLANCSGHEVRWALYWEKLLKEKNT